MSEGKGGLFLFALAVLVIFAILLIVIFVVLVPGYLMPYAQVTSSSGAQTYTVPIVGVAIVSIVAMLGIFVVVIVFMRERTTSNR